MTHKLATWIDQFGTLGLRRLRPLHHLVPGRDRHHRGGGGDPRHGPSAVPDRVPGSDRRDESAIAGLLGESPASRRACRRRSWSWIAGCAQNARFDAGDLLFREGERSGRLLRCSATGRVALEIYVPGRGAGDRRDARATASCWAGRGCSRPTAGTSTRASSSRSRAIAFDGACLRGKCEADHDLGYELMKRFAPVIIERLQATRLRLLDVYGRAATG